MDSFALFIASSVINVITDVVMLVIPLVAIWNLHMATRRKVGIGAIFAVGTAYVCPPQPPLHPPFLEINFFFFVFFVFFFFKFYFSFISLILEAGAIGLWKGKRVGRDLAPQYTHKDRLTRWIFNSALGSSLARLAWQLRHAKDTNRTVVLQKVSLLA